MSVGVRINLASSPRKRGPSGATLDSRLRGNDEETVVRSGTSR